ncbi:hypothetical protein ABT288_24855 [Streptomyces sp. NPDC001093]|uniref:hypothetical protein n=1 Tax=Streptomyces sp. NPDC001093 TaxID=3154376 RepID=UPI003324C951
MSALPTGFMLPEEYGTLVRVDLDRDRMYAGTADGHARVPAVGTHTRVADQVAALRAVPAADAVITSDSAQCCCYGALPPPARRAGRQGRRADGRCP